MFSWNDCCTDAEDERLNRAVHEQVSLHKEVLRPTAAFCWWLYCMWCAVEWDSTCTEDERHTGNLVYCVAAVIFVRHWCHGVSLTLKILHPGFLHVSTVFRGAACIGHRAEAIASMLLSPSISINPQVYPSFLLTLRFNWGKTHLFMKKTLLTGKQKRAREMDGLPIHLAWTFIIPAT